MFAAAHRLQHLQHRDAKRERSAMGDTTTADAAATAAQADITIPRTVILRAPRKYHTGSNASNTSTFVPPPLSWLQRTWAVTHSTLPMWRNAKNVRITYKILEGGRLDDEVTSVPITKTWLPQPKSIKGVDTPDGEGGWKWRGNGWLKIASSQWEVLGWGEWEEEGKERGEEVGDGVARKVEREKEQWVVTWFAPSLFTPEGVDIYSSSRGGLSPALLEKIESALKELDAKEVAELCGQEMREVALD